MDPTGTYPHHPGWIRLGVAMLVALASVASALASSSPPSPRAQSARACAGANASYGQVSTRSLRRATLCLMNRERRRRGLRALRWNQTLALAATRHARDMVGRKYFSHDSPGGSSPLDRVRRVGYLRRGTSFLVGEVLGWGTGSRGTPRGVVSAWMRSPVHRADILHRGFRQVGIAIVPGSPIAGAGAATTYVGVFGRRSRAAAAARAARLTPRSRPVSRKEPSTGGAEPPPATKPPPEEHQRGAGAPASPAPPSPEPPPGEPPPAQPDPVGAAIRQVTEVVEALPVDVPPPQTEAARAHL